MCSVSKASCHPLGARSGQAKDLTDIPYSVRFQEAARMFSQCSTDFENGGRDRSAIAGCVAISFGGGLT
jgi:hypothetical protein